MELKILFGVVIIGIIIGIIIYGFYLGGRDVLDKAFKRDLINSMIIKGMMNALLGFSIAVTTEYSNSRKLDKAFNNGFTGATAGFMAGVVSTLVIEAFANPAQDVILKRLQRRAICDVRCNADHLRANEKIDCHVSCMNASSDSDVTKEIVALASAPDAS